MNKRFSSVKTDDKVFDLNFGEGIVASLSRDSDNPIIIGGDKPKDDLI